MLFAISSSCALKISNEGNKMEQKEGLCYAPAPGFGEKVGVDTMEAANPPGPRPTTSDITAGEDGGLWQCEDVPELTTTATRMKDSPD